MESGRTKLRGSVLISKVAAAFKQVAEQQEQAEAMAAAQRVLALRAPACEDAVPRRIRVLCLHGFRQTSKVLRVRMALRGWDG